MKTDELYNKAAAYCSTAERCRQDVKDKLAAWDPENTDGNGEIVHRLEAEGFLNEDRYARAFANDKLRFQGWGRLKIRAALKQKNVPESSISSALSGLEEATYEAVLDKLRTKAAKTKGDEMKVMRFLLSRGFTYDEIRNQK